MIFEEQMSSLVGNEFDMNKSSRKWPVRPRGPSSLAAVQNRPLWTTALLFWRQVPNFVCSYCFPNQYPEVFEELQGRPLYEEKSPRVEESLAYPCYPGRANISYISLPKLGV